MKPLFQPFYCVIFFIRCEFMVQLVYPSKKGISDIIASAHQNHALSVPVDMEQPVLFGGDNFVALSSLIQSGYEGKIDLVYIDPPYNTNQIFTVETDRTSTISRSKNGDTAYRDDMPVEDYLEFMRERLVLIRELLSEQGSLYLHIDQKMGHYLKILLDEIFGSANFKNDIARIKSNPKNFGRRAFGNQKDMVLFYAKNGKKTFSIKLLILWMTMKSKLCSKKRKQTADAITPSPSMRRAKRSMAKRAVNGGGCCRLKAGIGEARPQNWIFWTGKV